MLKEGDVFSGNSYECIDDIGEKQLEFHVDYCVKVSIWTPWPDELS